MTTDIGKRLHLNTAIAAVMELVNELYGFFDRQPLVRAEREAVREAFVALSKLLVPLAPHLAEEIHAGLGLPGIAARSRWPEADRSLLEEEKVQIVVQVGGRLRGRIDIRRGASEGEAVGAARTDERVRAAIGERGVARIVFVPDRLLNIVLE